MTAAPAADLPGYDPYLRAFHTAFKPELAAVVRRYRPTRFTRVLDVPCGDGFYTALFARHMRGGTLVAADASDEYLSAAESRVPATAGGPAVAFRRVDVYAMPFAADAFDLVWCAQSMISLEHPAAALREMGRVLRPGGRVGVLETDEFHHVVLPWPVGLELAVNRAVRDACKRKYGSGEKFAQSRKLRAAFRAAGLVPTRKTTIAADRQAPFAPAERAFLERHFAFLREFAGSGLSAAETAAFDRFAGPDEGGMSGLRDAEFTVLASVSHARKPALPENLP